MKKTIRRIISVLLALAMTVTSIVYTPRMVRAADVLTGASGKTYTINPDNITGDYAGDTFVYTGIVNGNAFYFDWSAEYNSGVTVSIKNDSEEVVALGDYSGILVDISINQLDNANLSAGDYTIVIEGKGAQIGTQRTIPLTVAEAEVTEPEGKTSANVIELATPEGAALYDFRLGSLKAYRIEFTDKDADMTVLEGDTKSFEVFVNGISIAEVNKSGAIIEATALDSIEFADETKLADGTEYTVSVKEVLERKKGEDTETITSAESTSNSTFTYDAEVLKPLENKIPRIYVTTVRNDKTKRETLLFEEADKTKVDASLIIENAGNIEAEDIGTISVRGNSTAGADKKPYNIKFASKVKPFGIGTSKKGEKKWSLLANAFDKTLLRNQIGFEFHNWVEANYQAHQFSSEFQPVDLYVDGKYLGSYLFIESVAAGEDRVNIDAEEPSNNDILLELDASGRDEGSDAHLDAKTSMGMNFTINEPEGYGKDVSQNPEHPEYGDWQVWEQDFKPKKDRVIQFLNDFEKTLQEDGQGNINDIAEYIDLDSFVNYYITAELFKIKDISYSSVRFYIKDGKMYAGPLWDMDLSSGNDDGAEGGTTELKAQTNVWYRTLMLNKDFNKKVVERYEELLPQIKQIYADGGSIDTAANQIRESAEANYTQAYDYDNDKDKTEVDTYGTGWGYKTVDSSGGRNANLADVTHGGLAPYDNYDSYVTDFKNWMAERNSYLIKTLGISDENATYDKVEDQIADRFYNLALRKNVELYKTCHQEGKKEFINDGSFTTGKCVLTNADATDSFGTHDAEVYATVDLGAIYDAAALDSVIVSYASNRTDWDSVQGKSYSIQYSLDGIHFYDAVKDRQVNDLDVGTLRTTDEVFRVEGKVRYVRVYYPRQATYGMQITEIAVLDTDKDAQPLEPEEVQQPTFEVRDLEAENEFEVNITNPEGVTEYTYDILVDGVVIKSGVQSGPTTLKVSDKGTYTISVIAYHNGFMSQETDGQDVNVSGTLSMKIPEQVATAKYNLALNKKGIVVKPKNGEGNLLRVTDGVITDDEHCALAPEGNFDNNAKPGPVSITIDLEKYYKASSIENILIRYTNYSAGVMNDKNYTISYSLSGREDDFYDVCDNTVQIKNDDLMTNYTLDKVGSVNQTKARASVPDDYTMRYVRVEYTGTIPGWGVQLTEVAVLSASAEEVTPTAVTAPEITLGSSADGNIDLTINATEDMAEYQYIVCIDGVEQVYKDTDNNEFQLVTAGSYTYTGQKPGIHTVTVQAIYNGFYSEKVTQTVRVMGTVEFNEEQMLIDPLYNLAYQQMASSSGTKDEGSSVDNVKEKSVTDGNVKEWNNYTALTPNDGSWIQVELNEPYLTESIDQITVWYRSFINECIPTSNSNYEIQFSKDGENFVTVPRTSTIVSGNKVTGQIDEGRYVVTDVIDTAEAAKLIPRVKSVRIVYNKTSNWGIQIREVAVFNTDATAEPAKWTQEVDPLTAEELEAEGVKDEDDDTYWVRINENSDYYYHIADENKYGVTLDADYTILHIAANSLTGDLQSVTYNGLPVSKAYAGVGSGMDIKRIRSYGVYKVDIIDKNGTAGKLYIRRKNDSVYGISGIAVTGAITPDKVNVIWDATQDTIDDGCTYNVILDQGKENEVRVDGIVEREYQFEGLNLTPGEHNVTVEAVFNGTVVAPSEDGLITVTPCEFELIAKPDLAVTNVKVEGEELAVGKKVTVTVTIKNVGLADAVMKLRDDGNVHLVPKRMFKNGNDKNDWWALIPASAFTLKDGNYVLQPGEECSKSWEENLTEWMIQQGTTVEGYITYEGGMTLDEYRIDNNRMEIPLKIVPIPNNLKYSFNNDGTATLTWDRPNDDNQENTYMYNVYVNGEKVNADPINDLSYVVKNLISGNNDIKITALVEGLESQAASMVIFNYSIEESKWEKWVELGNPSNNKDSYGNKWYYYDGYDWSNLLPYESEPHFIGLVNDALGAGNKIKAPLFEIMPTYNGGKNSHIQSVIINGDIYASDENGVYCRDNDRCTFRQSFFELQENEPEKIFAITLLGDKEVNNQKISILFKVVNGRDSQVFLNNNDGLDVATWRAAEDAVRYELTYTADSKTETVDVGNNLTYEFKDAAGNVFYPDNNTEVIVTAYGEDGNALKDGKYTGTALADLVITDIITPEAAAVGQNTTVTVKYKNIGTAKATPKAGQNNYAIRIIETDVEGTKESKVGWSTDFIAPNESASVDVIFDKWLRQEGYTTLEVEVDEADRVPELNDSGNKNAENNIQRFELYGINPNNTTLTYIENASEIGSNVKAEWKKADGADSYYFVYESNGQTVKYDIHNEIPQETEDGTKLYMGVTDPIDHNTDFKVYAIIDGKSQLLGVTRAMADLTIDSVSEPVSSNGKQVVQIGYTFSVDVTIKNIGTGQVRKFVPEGDDWTVGYGNYTLCVSVQWEDENGKSNWITNDACTDGLAVGGTLTRKLEKITPTGGKQAGVHEQKYTYWVDHYGDGDGVQFIDESKEDNNTLKQTYTINAYEQNKEMEWTRLVSDDASIAPKGDIYLFPIANGSQKAYIDYKVIDSSITTMDYKDIMNKYDGYGGANMSIGFNPDSGRIVQVRKEGEEEYSNTRFEFAQLPGYSKANDSKINADTIQSAKWIDMAMQGTTIQYTDEKDKLQTIEPKHSRSPVGYVGNGFNFYVGNFGLYKYYAVRLTNPEGSGQENVTVVFRVTDDQEHTGMWQQAYTTDRLSDPNALPMYYCGQTPMLENDSLHYIGEGKHDYYETKGAVWYDASDIELSSISIYNGNWLAISTSQYTQFAEDAGTEKKWMVKVARAKTIPEQNNKFDGAIADSNGVIWHDVDPQTEGAHVGIQGTNTVQVGLPWLFDDIPIHSSKGGEKDLEFYYIRVIMDREKYDETNDETYIEIPITLYADIPEIQPVENASAWEHISAEDDQDEITLTWNRTTAQEKYGYVYRVFIGDDTTENGENNLVQIDSEGKQCTSDVVYTQGQTLTFKQDTLNSIKDKDGNKVFNGNIFVKAYWCEQEVTTKVTVAEDPKEGWYPLYGQSEIEIQAGQNELVKMPGKISYYYDIPTNHASSVVGYNGYFITLNGNKNYYNENSKVSVLTQHNFKSREDIENVIYNIQGTGDDREIISTKDEPAIPQGEFKYVKPYERIGGQLQITASDLMTANHKTTWYLVKISSEGTEMVDGVEVPKEYVTYVMLESVVHSEGDVAVRGYQMNTDATPGAVSEFGPSFRVVSRASKVVEVPDKTEGYAENPLISAVIKQGTIYALKDSIGSSSMDIQYDKETKTITTAPNVYHIEATAKTGLLENWSGSVDDKDRSSYNYYAVTFKAMEYSRISLTSEYKVRAYAVTDDGQIIYETPDEKSVKDVSIYRIAEKLYQNSEMPSEAAHNYLYDNVLNIVAISQNYINIGTELLKALNITSASDSNYQYVNAMYRDLYYYSYLAGEYKYEHYMQRGSFTSKTKFEDPDNEGKMVENEILLLKALNGIDETRQYSSTAQWVQTNVTTNGFYQKQVYAPKIIVKPGVEI